MLDLDGTTIPNQKDGMPSDKVTNAIAKASKKIHVGVATSRPLFMLHSILDQLKLSGPSVINAGSQIIDANLRHTLWEQAIDKKDASIVYETIKDESGLSIIINDGETDHLIKTNQLPKNILQIYLQQLSHDHADKYISLLSHVPTLAIHKVPAWKDGLVDLLITHAMATKQHAIYEVAKNLNIETHEIIGVGDGYNDFPLLMACGLKVAMGNAVPELKEIADYIAPSVDEDGVVDIIKKFVLE